MARGRKPLGKKAMTDAERQRRHRERKAYEVGAIKKEISRLTRAQIRQYRLAKMENDLALSIRAAKFAYADEPERLKTALITLRRMAAGFRGKPSTYSTEALLRSDKTAQQRWFIGRAERLGARVLSQRPAQRTHLASIILEDGTYIGGDLDMVEDLLSRSRRSPD